MLHVANALKQFATSASGVDVIAKSDKSSIVSRVQTAFNATFKDPRDQAIASIIIEYAMKSESLGPGTFLDVLKGVTEGVSESCYGPHGNDCHGSLVGNSVGSRVASREDMVAIMAKFCSDSQVRDVLSEALVLAGFGGRIAVERSHSQVISVELVRGYTFDQGCAIDVSVHAENARIICVDGIIESVSEIHHVLEEASQTRDYVVLFVRGLADDVRHTLSVNFNRGTLKVVPVVVKFDLEGLNTINDVAIVCGAKLVSSNTGDLISSVRLADAAVVEEVWVDKVKTSIRNRSSARAVTCHVEDLRRRRTEVHEDVATLMDARIRSLSPNHVVIRLPDDLSFVSRSQSIDVCLRAMRSLVDYGVIDTSSGVSLAASSVASRICTQKCINALSMIGDVITTAA